jgi:hypothetical protein
MLCDLLPRKSMEAIERPCRDLPLPLDPLFADSIAGQHAQRQITELGIDDALPPTL